MNTLNCLFVFARNALLIMTLVAYHMAGYYAQAAESSLLSVETSPGTSGKADVPCTWASTENLVFKVEKTKVRSLRTFCWPGITHALDPDLYRVYFSLTIKDSYFEDYRGRSCKDVEEQYRSKEIRYPSLGWRVRYVRLDDKIPSCFGVDTSQGYTASFEIYDKRLLNPHRVAHILGYITGVCMILVAQKLSRNTAFYRFLYFGNELVKTWWLVASFLVSRLLIRKTAGVLFLMWISAVMICFYRRLWKNLWEVVLNYPNYVAVHIVAVSVATCVRMPRFEGVQSARTMENWRLTLQFIGVGIIYLSCTIGYLGLISVFGLLVLDYSLRNGYDFRLFLLNIDNETLPLRLRFRLIYAAIWLYED